MQQGFSKILLLSDAELNLWGNYLFENFDWLWRALTALSAGLRSCWGKVIVILFLTYAEMVRNNWLYLRWFLHTLMKGDKAVEVMKILANSRFFFNIFRKENVIRRKLWNGQLRHASWFNNNLMIVYCILQEIAVAIRTNSQKPYNRRKINHSCLSKPDFSSSCYSNSRCFYSIIIIVISYYTIICESVSINRVFPFFNGFALINISSSKYLNSFIPQLTLFPSVSKFVCNYSFN